MVTNPQVTVGSLRSLPLFSELGEASLQHLIELGRARRLARHESLSTKRTATAESYCFVVDGVMAVTLGEHQTTTGENPNRYLGYFESGECFSDGFLHVPVATPTDRIDCVAIGSSLLFEVDSSHLSRFLSAHPGWHQRLSDSLKGSRERFSAHQEPGRRVVQDFLLHRGFVNSGRVHVENIDHCLNCRKCEEACASRHGGVSRMVRGKVELGCLAFPITCQTCRDKPCMASCKLNGLVYDEKANEVQVTEKCGGCGKCIAVCPYGAIQITQYKKGTAVRRRAVKCDHCKDFDEPACLEACPTGALFQVSGMGLLMNAGDMSASGVQSRPLLTDTPFVDGPPSLRPVTFRQWLYHPFFTVVMLTTLVALGVEVYLRAVHPDASLSALLLPRVGFAGPITFRSGRGLGHWLGYIGTVAMIASVVYSLRARVRRFERWGKMATWLSAHQWLGLIGGTLVTYHSALKLDRWASIACFLMWVVLGTGILGRYVKGRTRTGMNLLEFERKGQSRRWFLGVERLALVVADSALKHWNIVHIVLAILMFILAGIHVVYGFLYKAV